MEVTVVIHETQPDVREVFGVYKTPQAARSAIKLFLDSHKPRGRYSLMDFDEISTDVED